MSKDDLTPLDYLVDYTTGEKVGIIFSGAEIPETNGTAYYHVALSMDRIKELNLDVLSYIDYLDIPNKKVLVYRNKFVDINNVINLNDDFREDSDLDFESYGTTASIWGYLFETRFLIELDSEYSLNLALGNRLF